MQQAEIFVILGPFLPIYSTKKPKNQNFEKMKKNSWRYYIFTFFYYEWQPNNVWFLRYGVQQAKSFLILDHFLSFYWKIKILKKKPRDIVSLHSCTKNDNQMMCGSLDVKCNRQNFLDYFLPFQPQPSLPLPKNVENQYFYKMKKKKKMHKCINENHTMYGSWDMECDRLNFFSL